MGGRYVKLQLIVPTKESLKDLDYRIKKMPIVTNFRPTQMELRVYPTENKKFITVEVIMT